MIFTLPVLAFIAAFGFYLWNSEKQKNAVIDRERNRYQSLTKNVNDALLIIDVANGRILDANNRACEWLGYSEKQLATKTVMDIFPPDMTAKSALIVAEVWEKGGAVFKDLPLYSAYGELLPVECSAKVLTFAERPSVAIYARDIRERLRLENEILAQKQLIEEKNENLTDSIVYARRIQEAILPDLSLLDKSGFAHFVAYEPRDIVSGDFYWFQTIEIDGSDFYFFAAADCTGHGVPGAFMSILGSTLLNKIVREQGVVSPDQILNELNREVRRALKQDYQKTGALDGMDVALCRLCPQTRTVVYAGAFRPLYQIKTENGETIIHEVTATRSAVGGVQQSENLSFEAHTLQLSKGDAIYLFTDGITDQFGIENKRKFGYKRLKEQLLSLHRDNIPMEEQAVRLKNQFKAWQGSLEQTDDRLILGVRV